MDTDFDPNTAMYAESAGMKYRLMGLPDFRKFRDLALTDDPAWTTHYKGANIHVQSKPPPPEGGTSLNIVRVRREMLNVEPECLYNNFHDATYRETWDKNMIEGYNIVVLNPHNDIGYYAAKFPWPLTNRDFCNMRSWMEFTNGDYIIFNHSEPHNSCPVKKGFIRAKSILTGYYVQPRPEGGLILTFVSHSDPCGSIPHAVINFTMSKMVPNMLNTCEKCAETYPEFVAKTYPADQVFAWRTPKMDWDSDLMFPEDAAKAAKQAESTPKKENIAENGDTPSNEEPRMLNDDESGEVHGTADGAFANGGAVSGNEAELRKELETMRKRLFVAQQTSGVGLTSLAPVSVSGVDEPVSVQQYRALMQDSLNTVDRLFIQQGHIPSTLEYLTRLSFFIEGIRRTTPVCE